MYHIPRVLSRDFLRIFQEKIDRKTEKGAENLRLLTNTYIVQPHQTISPRFMVKRGTKEVSAVMLAPLPSVSVCASG